MVNPSYRDQLNMYANSAYLQQQGQSMIYNPTQQQQQSQQQQQQSQSQQYHSQQQYISQGQFIPSQAYPVTTPQQMYQQQPYINTAQQQLSYGNQSMYTAPMGGIFYQNNAAMSNPSANYPRTFQSNIPLQNMNRPRPASLPQSSAATTPYNPITAGKPMNPSTVVANPSLTGKFAPVSSSTMAPYPRPAMAPSMATGAPTSSIYKRPKVTAVAVAAIPSEAPKVVSTSDGSSQPAERKITASWQSQSTLLKAAARAGIPSSSLHSNAVYTVYNISSHSFTGL